MITASNRNTVKLNEDSGCPLSLQEVPQRRGGESGHSTLWWFGIKLITETETVKHSAVWAELKLPESIDVNHILNLHADAEVQKKNTFLLFTFKHFLPSIFSHFISSTLDFLQGSTKVWSLTGFPLWHPDNRECVRLILLKCVFDAFMSRHIQHCQCFAADSRATDKKTNKFAQN